jgi:hypothetical protein
VAALNHPNVLALYDIGSEDGMARYQIERGRRQFDFAAGCFAHRVMLSVRVA